MRDIEPLVAPPTKAQRDIIRNIATSFHRTNHQVPAEDIRQQLYLQWFEQWPQIQQYATSPDGKPRLIKTLQNWAGRYCRQEKAQQAGYDPRDQYHYSTGQIEQMLPLVESPASWSSLATPEHERAGGKNVADPALGNDALARYADLTSGWHRLSEQQRMILRARYFGDTPEPYEVLGARIGRSVETTAVYRQRAVEKLQRLMNGEYVKRQPPPVVRAHGGRHAISNAHAVAITSRDWGGE